MARNTLYGIRMICDFCGVFGEVWRERPSIDDDEAEDELEAKGWGTVAKEEAYEMACPSCLKSEAGT